jgi:hypothetical protein
MTHPIFGRGNWLKRQKNRMRVQSRTVEHCGNPASLVLEDCSNPATLKVRGMENPLKKIYYYEITKLIGIHQYIVFWVFHGKVLHF